MAVQLVEHHKKHFVGTIRNHGSTPLLGAKCWLLFTSGAYSRPPLADFLFNLRDWAAVLMAGLLPDILGGPSALGRGSRHASHWAADTICGGYPRDDLIAAKVQE